MELDRESHELGHCVHSYKEAVKTGTCVILFLRRADEPDRPFFTMEYDCRNRLRQIRGKGDRYITDINDKSKILREDLIEFLLEWGTQNHILTGFERRERAVS